MSAFDFTPCDIVMNDLPMLVCWDDYVSIWARDLRGRLGVWRTALFHGERLIRY